MNTKVGLISLGCAKNLVDSEHMLARLREAGCEIVDDMAEAEVGIVNTCGFIESAKTEAIETILETAQYKQAGTMHGLVVTGCLAQRYRDEIVRDLPEVDVICGTGSYTDIVDAVAAADKREKRAYFGPMDAADLEGDRDRLTPGYTAYFKIAEGCSNTCAYCIIPKLRGKYRSRDYDALLAEARALSDAGVKELIVIAQDITKYGIDRYGKRRLPELLRALCQMDFTWIRLHYLYPDQITEELIDVIAEEDKIVKYLDIPLQHVSKRILRAMRRPGDRESLTALIGKLRERIPGVVLRTSLIVGLPGETEEEFQELCDFLREYRLERAGVFAFSPEEGAPAASMPGQIDDETKNRRQAEVFALQQDIMNECSAALIGQELTVLCCGTDESGRQYGRSYMDSPDVDGVVFFDEETPEGQFVRVRILDAAGCELFGEKVGE